MTVNSVRHGLLCNNQMQCMIVVDGFVGYELALSLTYFGHIGSFTSCRISNIMEHFMAQGRFLAQMGTLEVGTLYRIMTHMPQIDQVKNVSFTEKVNRSESFCCFLLLVIFLRHSSAVLLSGL